MSHSSDPRTAAGFFTEWAPAWQPVEYLTRKSCKLIDRDKRCPDPAALLGLDRRNRTSGRMHQIVRIDFGVHWIRF